MNADASRQVWVALKAGSGRSYSLIADAKTRFSRYHEIAETLVAAIRDSRPKRELLVLLELHRQMRSVGDREFPGVLKAAIRTHILPRGAGRRSGVARVRPLVGSHPIEVLRPVEGVQ